MAEQQRTSQFLRLGLRERRTLLILVDLILAGIALGVALIAWGMGEEWLGLSLAFLRERVAGWFYFLPFVWLFLIVGLYDVHRSADRRQVLRGVATATGLGFLLYLIVYFASQNPLPRRGVAVFLITASLLTLWWRLLYIQVFTAPQFMRRVLLVGAGRAGSTILQEINALETKPFDLVGLVDDDCDKMNTEIEGHTVIANCGNLLELVEEKDVSDIIVAISGALRGQTFQALLDAQEQGVEITRMPVAYEELVHRVPIKILETDWILRSFVDEVRVHGFYEILKRMIDILGGLVGVTIMILLFPMIGLGILLDSGRPIFYAQERLGKGGKIYKIFKFRTMAQDAETDGKPRLAQENDHRVTRMGRLLRKTHLDELPQFINVLRGDMSLVGPRAERPKLVARFQRQIPFYRARLLVKPGITGWAQVNYGYAATVDETSEKLEYDLYYIKHRSLVLDALIILRTPATIFGLKGQ
jgi:exopolysaccharide biosynthesis polyprenyl glycosylphosphotransferase